LLTLTGYRQGYRRFFGPGVRPEIIPLKPNERFNERAMNDKVPQEEWGVNRYTGQPQGPYEGYRELTFIDELTMTPWAYSVPIGTVGGSQAIQELRKVTRWARKFKDPNLSPRVLLRDRPMPTSKYGIVTSPYFEIQTDRWATIAGYHGNKAHTLDAEANDDIGVEETPAPDFKGDKVPY
jgi:hypothetical protein